jgi:SPP1 gp7 family putative phage head morphogenesis protein
MEGGMFTRLRAHAEAAYRRAVAAQVEQAEDDADWDEWEQDTAAILLGSWASGALLTLQTGGVPANAVLPRVTFAIADDVTMRWSGGPSREVVRRFVRLLPMTRSKWEELVQKAFEAAQELRIDEQQNALARILDRSPDLARLLSPTAAAVDGATEEIRKRRTGAVQAAVQGSFFVTGMSLPQIKAVQGVLAQAIRGDITVSTAGKQVETMGVGDFVSHTVMQTGTDLTTARLETVFRTNSNRAQSQGRLDIVRDETVRKFVPLMQFRATRDKRTRETHKAMNGYVATVDQIDAQGIPTPLGFNCRCSWAPVSIATAISNGWCKNNGDIDYGAIRKHNGDRQKLIDTGEVPDSGFISG